MLRINLSFWVLLVFAGLAIIDTGCRDSTPVLPVPLELSPSPEPTTASHGPATAQTALAQAATWLWNQQERGDILEAKFDSGQSVTLYFIIQHATAKMFDGKSIEQELKEQNKKKKNN